MERQYEQPRLTERLLSLAGGLVGISLALAYIYFTDSNKNIQHDDYRANRAEITRAFDKN